MSTFGDLIEAQIPVLFNFFSEGSSKSDSMNPVLRNVAAAMGDKARIIKIDVAKNIELVNALRVIEVPTLIIYKDGEMKWRHSGEQDSKTLIDLLSEYV